MPKRSGWLVVAIALLGILAGCSSYSELAQIRSELIALGFDDAGVHVRHFEGTKRSEDRVEVVLVGDPMDDDAAREGAATLIWNELPVRFDTLLIEYQDEVTVASYAELEAQLGPRSAGMDDQSIIALLGAEIGAFFAALGTILVVAMVPISVLVRRSRRRRRRENREPWASA
ncbi:hypothetical protein [Promicromonospora panici]|uniref:hypothetical protein n=1 Tax=Promicromonospora panici TaxID=2219658 RepID=UPI00101CCE6A|nr:hypothetical protein [Promicromonospora panici]